MAETPAKSTAPPSGSLLKRSVPGLIAWSAILALTYVAFSPGLFLVRGASESGQSGAQLFISDRQFCAARCEPQEDGEKCAADCQAVLSSLGRQEQPESALAGENLECVKEKCEPLRVKCLAEADDDNEAALKCETLLGPCISACVAGERDESDDDE